jgi:pilus assembly protein CpaB
MRRLTPAGVSTTMVIVVGLLVTAYFAKLMRAEEPRIQPPATASQALDAGSAATAATTLEPGTIITAAQLGTTRLRPDALPPDALVQTTLIGRVVRERITSGSVIRASQLYPPGERPTLAVSRGMRAVAVALRRGVAPIGGLQEGQYVDVYLTPRADASKTAGIHGGVTLTLFRGVKLLAINRSASVNEPEDVATLELSPEQATVLILAGERGNIALAYNPEGKGNGGIALKNQDRATLDEILGLPPNPAETASGGGFTSEVYKGNERSTRQFDAAPKAEASSTPTPANLSPLWTRKSRAKSVPVPPPERMSMVPGQTAIR